MSEKLKKLKPIFVVLFLMPVASVFIPLRKLIKLEDICWFSGIFWDVHDYPVEFGGDGYPTHFYEYTCSRCQKKFNI